jgi:hypothetical protein
MKKRFSEEQIIGFLKEVDAGIPAKELCRKQDFPEASYYRWRSKFGWRGELLYSYILMNILGSILIDVTADVTIFSYSKNI